MDMDTLGYFVFMDEKEQASPNTSANLFGDSSDSEDDDMKMNNRFAALKA